MGGDKLCGCIPKPKNTRLNALKCIPLSIAVLFICTIFIVNGILAILQLSDKHDWARIVGLLMAVLPAVWGVIGYLGVFMKKPTFTKFSAIGFKFLIAPVVIHLFTTLFKIGSLSHDIHKLEDSQSLEDQLAAEDKRTERSDYYDDAVVEGIMFVLVVPLAWYAISLIRSLERLQRVYDKHGFRIFYPEVKRADRRREEQLHQQQQQQQTA